MAQDRTDSDTCPDFKAAGMQWRLPTHLGRRGVAAPSQAYPAPGAWPTQESGDPPLQLSDSVNLTGRSGVSMSPQVQEPPQSGWQFLPLVSRPEEGARGEQGSRNLSGLMLLQVPDRPNFNSRLRPQRTASGGGWAQQPERPLTLGDPLLRSPGCGQSRAAQVLPSDPAWSLQG